MIGVLEVTREAGKGSTIQYGPEIPFYSDLELPAGTVSIRLEIFSSDFLEKAGGHKLVFSFQSGDCEGFRMQGEEFKQIDALSKSLVKRFCWLDDFFKMCRREILLWYPELIWPEFTSQTVH